MGSSFYNIFETIASPLIDQVYGEPFLITPRAPPPAPGGGPPDVNARRPHDTSRPVTPFIGVWDDPNLGVFPHSPGLSDNTAPKLSAGKTTVDYQTSSLPFQPVIGDKITRMADGSTYAIENILSDGINRTRLALGSAQGTI